MEYALRLLTEKNPNLNKSYYWEILDFLKTFTNSCVMTKCNGAASVPGIYTEFIDSYVQ